MPSGPLGGPRPFVRGRNEIMVALSGSMPLQEASRLVRESASSVGIDVQGFNSKTDEGRVHVTIEVNEPLTLSMLNDFKEGIENMGRSMRSDPGDVLAVQIE